VEILLRSEASLTSHRRHKCPMHIPSMGHGSGRMRVSIAHMSGKSKGQSEGGCDVKFCKSEIALDNRPITKPKPLPPLTDSLPNHDSWRRPRERATHQDARCRSCRTIRHTLGGPSQTACAAPERTRMRQTGCTSRHGALCVRGEAEQRGTVPHPDTDGARRCKLVSTKVYSAALRQDAADAQETADGAARNRALHRCTTRRRR
jgi:hypothetical protein